MGESTATYAYAAGGNVWWPAELVVAGNDPANPSEPQRVPFKAFVTPRRRKERREQAAGQMSKLSQSLAASIARGESPEELAAKSQQLVDDAMRDESELLERVHGWSGITIVMPDGRKFDKFDREALAYAIGDDAMYTAFATAVEAASATALPKN